MLARARALRYADKLWYGEQKLPSSYSNICRRRMKAEAQAICERFETHR